MTQLQTISNNHMSLECRCGHSKLLSVKELIGRLSVQLLSCVKIRLIFLPCRSEWISARANASCYLSEGPMPL